MAWTLSSPCACTSYNILKTRSFPMTCPMRQPSTPPTWFVSRLESKNSSRRRQLRKSSSSKKRQFLLLEKCTRNLFNSFFLLNSRNLKEHHHELILDKKKMDQYVGKLNEVCNKMMVDKFGKLVDLEKLEMIIVNQQIEELKQRMLENEEAHVEHMKSWKVCVQFGRLFFKQIIAIIPCVDRTR